MHFPCAGDPGAFVPVGSDSHIQGCQVTITGGGGSCPGVGVGPQECPSADHADPGTRAAAPRAEPRCHKMLSDDIACWSFPRPAGTPLIPCQEEVLPAWSDASFTPVPPPCSQDMAEQGWAHCKQRLYSLRKMNCSERKHSPDELCGITRASRC